MKTFKNFSLLEKGDVFYQSWNEELHTCTVIRKTDDGKIIFTKENTRFPDGTYPEHKWFISDLDTDRVSYLTYNAAVTAINKYVDGQINKQIKRHQKALDKYKKMYLNYE